VLRLFLFLRRVVALRRRCSSRGGWLCAQCLFLMLATKLFGASGIEGHTLVDWGVTFLGDAFLGDTFLGDAFLGAILFSLLGLVGVVYSGRY